MMGEFSYSLGLKCKIPNGVTFRLSSFLRLNTSTDLHCYLVLLEGTNIYTLHTLGVYPIYYLFRQYPLWTFYQLWQPVKLHLLMLGLVNNLWNCQLEYLEATNVKDGFTNQFTLVLWHSGLQVSSTWSDSVTMGTGLLKCIYRVLRSQAVNSVSNASNPLERFGVRVGTGTKPLQQFYHMNTVNCCIWAGFHLKTRPLQTQMFRSNSVFEFWSYREMINM